MKLPEKLYMPLCQNASPDDDDAPTSIARPRSCAVSFLILSNIVLGVILGVALFRLKHGTQIEPAPVGFARTSDLPTVYASFTWWTEYSDKNEIGVDALWDEILPSHGIIAMDRKWAADQHWPDSMPLPDDDSKSIYLLEAYHQLHCLKIIRQNFWEAVKRGPYTYNPAHAGHCFDFFRQFIYCNADNTPLYTFGDYTAGNGQLRECKDWNVLRDWATENTACYKDSVNPIPLGDHFGYCDGGKDGLVKGEQDG